MSTLMSRECVNLLSMMSDIMKFSSSTRLGEPLGVNSEGTLQLLCLGAAEVVQIAVATAVLHYMPPFQPIRRRNMEVFVLKTNFLYSQRCVYFDERGVCQLAILTQLLSMMSDIGRK